MWCENLTMWGWNYQIWEKNKKIIKCDKKIVTCDVGTAQREDGTIKCDVLITWYSRFDVGQGRTTNSDLENQGRSGRDWVLKNSG